MRVQGTWRFADASWDDALGELERLARSAGDSVVLALSGSETVEIASALSQLVRGASAHTASCSRKRRARRSTPTARRCPPSQMPRWSSSSATIPWPSGRLSSTSDPSSAAERRRGDDVPTGRNSAATAGRRRGSWVAELADKRKATSKRLHAAERIALVVGPGRSWRSDAGAARRSARLANKPGSGAYFLPATPNGRSVAAAWEAASEGTAPAPERVGLLLISGEEAVADPRVRALAERATPSWR